MITVTVHRNTKPDVMYRMSNEAAYRQFCEHLPDHYPDSPCHTVDGLEMPVDIKMQAAGEELVDKQSCASAT